MVIDICKRDDTVTQMLKLNPDPARCSEDLVIWMGT